MSTNSWLLVCLGINLVFALVTKHADLAKGSNVALLLTMTGLTCIGFFFFNKDISRSQWVGIGLGLASVPLILGLIKF